MEKIIIEQDIRVLYVTAASFPEGIAAATEKLHSLFPFSRERKIFGLSRPENGGSIVYRAAAEVMEANEAEKLGCETMTIRKGNYISQTVDHFRRDPLGIARAFEQLLSEPGLDPNGYCVEWYATDRESVQCMVRLNTQL
jgi:hypothetical protein